MLRSFIVRISMYGADSTACMWQLPAGSMDDLMAGWMSVAWIFQTAAILCSKQSKSKCHRRTQNHACTDPRSLSSRLHAPCRRWIFFATHNVHRSKDPCRLHAPSLNILRLSPHILYVCTYYVRTQTTQHCFYMDMAMNGSSTLCYTAVVDPGEVSSTGFEDFLEMFGARHSSYVMT